MPVNPVRIKRLSGSEYAKGTVVYQMCRELRVRDNDALLFAQQLAIQRKEKFIVNYVIWSYLWEGSTRRFYDWVIPSLEEVEKSLRKLNIPLVVTFQERKKEKGKMPKHIGVVIIEELPLHFMNSWKREFLLAYPEVPLYEVDAHNCVPVWHTSSKQEFSARTIRSKLHKLAPLFLEEYEELDRHELNGDISKDFPVVNWIEVSSKIICDEKVKGLGVFTPGEAASKKALTHFFESGITTYGVDRNNINIKGQSGLSPYISHGNISRRRILLELQKQSGKPIGNLFDSIANGSNGKLGSVSSFIEECLIRAELSENYCYYNQDYDKVKGFPLWSQKTLNATRKDVREYVYSQTQWEEKDTHDELWNAAQNEMRVCGKMHGYMRMYWAKKILEWSESPEEALRIANYLNDTYELDGRDPNGYVGCAWSIGGVHDRPWFGRPIFGVIRYMARSGVEKRGDVRGYIENNSTSKLF